MKRQYDVEIEVSGGVAWVARKIRGVSIKITDWDNLEDENGDKRGGVETHTKKEKIEEGTTK